MYNYRFIRKIGEGTFSEVIEAQNVNTGKQVAIKCLKHTFPNKSDVLRLREVQTLRKLVDHPNIIRLYDVIFDSDEHKVYLIFELMERDLYDFISHRNERPIESQIQQWIHDILLALEYMHRNGLIHRDIKPENILIHNTTIKLADLGSARNSFESHPFTPYISTRWYRPPECLLSNGIYDEMMDLWALGCVTFEIISGRPLFDGESEIDQLDKIHQILGTPSHDVLRKLNIMSTIDVMQFKQYNGIKISSILPNSSKLSTDFIERLITYDPNFRLSAAQALNHPWIMSYKNSISAPIFQQINVYPSLAFKYGNVRRTIRPDTKREQDRFFSNFTQVNSINLPKINTKLSHVTRNVREMTPITKGTYAFPDIIKPKSNIPPI